MAAAQFTIDRLYTKDLYVNGAQITHPSLAALLTDHPSNNVGIGTNDPKVKLDINGTDALRLPAGNKISAASGGDRPANADANYCIRYNTDDNIFEGYSNGNWGSLGGVTSINQLVTITADNTYGLKFLTGPDGGSSLERMHILNDGTVNIGSITNVESVINSKAATTYVDTKIAGLVDSAPEALDTLNELAAALGDDANYAATVTTSLASKQATITGAATTITSSNLTASRALVSNSNSKVAVSAVTSTELGYLGGVKSSIQTQLDLKARLASPTFTGTVGGLDKTMVGLGNVDNYSKATMFTRPTFTGQVTATSGFIGDVTGNATTVTVTAENITSGTRYLTFVDSGTGPNSIKRDANLHYNPYNNMITAGGFYGTIYTAAQPQITSVGTLSSLNVNGNVGIGTSSPANKLSIQTGTNYDGIILNNEDGHLLFKAARSNTKSKFYIGMYDGTSAGAQKVIISNHGDSVFNAGNVGIGTSSPGAKLHVVGDTVVTGDITAYYSDERLKTFKGKITEPLAKIKQLNGYYFVENELAKSLGYDNDKLQVGVSAQEVEKVLPEIVTKAPIDHKYKTVWYQKLTPLLIEGMKEQQTQIEQQQTQIEQQQTQIQSLQEQIDELKELIKNI